MLALMPLILAFGAVLTSTAQWDGPAGTLYTTALFWGGAASVLLTLTAGLIRRAQLWRTGVPERVGSAMPAGAALLLLLVAVLAATGATPRPYDAAALIPGEPRAGEQPAERPNILLISIDTLRADHLGCYDYPRPVSPNIDGLAREGVLFEQTVCPLPRTVPALASMLTGLYPQDHGLRDNLRQALPLQIPTLAERLRDTGYHTFGVVANGLVHPTRGLARGFDYYYTPAMEWDRAPFLRTLYDRLVDDRTIPGERGTKIHFEGGESLTRRAIGLIRDFGRLPDNEPFFFWLHYYDPHMLYAPPPPWRTKFGEPYAGPYRKSMNYGLVSKGYMIYRCDLPERDRQRGVDLYDGEIGFTDQLVGRVLRTLEEAGLKEETIVVFTSDHGESLGEHDFYFDHGDFLYEPSMRIPLIFRLPDGTHAGRRVSRQATLMDLMPTLLEMTGSEPIELPASGYGGQSLLPEVMGALPAEEPTRAAFGESGFCFYPQLNDRLLIKPPPKTAPGQRREDSLLAATGLEGRLRMVRRDGWKLILTPAPDGDDRLELYDLRTDPEELTNLADDEPELTDTLLAELRRWMAADPGQGGTGGELDQAAIDRLKSLGYIQ
jgi:arylsulfatase A-like enzyme